MHKTQGLLARRLLKAAMVMVICLCAWLPLHAEWQPTEGPDGAFVWSLAGESDDLYCLVDNAVHRLEGGVWKRGGATISRELHYWNGSLFAVETIASQARLKVSNDGGITWQPADLPSPGRHEEITIHVTDNAVFAGFGSQVFRTSDAHAWFEFAECELNAGPIATIAGNDNLLLVLRAFSDEVCRFNAKGEALGSIELPRGAGFLASLEVRRNEYFVVTSGQGAYRSVDAGVTWEPANAGLELTPGGAFPRPVVMRAAQNANWMLDGSGNLWRYSNAAWQRVAVPFVAADILVNNNVLILATQEGVFHSPDMGITWEPRNAGLFYQNVETLFNNGKVLIANTNSTTVRSVDGGLTWEYSHDFPIRGVVEQGGVLFARMAPFDPNGVLYRSDDQGLTWQTLNNEFDSPLLDLADLTHDGEHLYVSFNGYFQLHGRGISRWGFGGVRRSADNGITWTDVSAGLPHDVNVPVPTPQVLAVEKALLLVTAAGVFRSETAGNTWTAVQAGLPPEATNYRLAADGRRVFLTLGVKVDTELLSEVYMSEDGGISWRSIGGGLPQLHDAEGQFQAQGIDIVNGTAYLHSFWGSEYHLFRFEDDVWQDETDELPPGIVLHTITGVDGTRYAGAANRGVWRDRDLTSTSVASSERGDSAVEIYPNPSGADITVKMDAASGPARIQLFDVRGVEVFSQEIQGNAAGIYSVALPAEITAGLYIYRVTRAASVFHGTLVRS